MHDFARPAAIAAQCADRQGAFQAFHDTLFAQVDSIGPKPWARFAREAGILDTAAFTHCLKDASVAAEITRDSLAASTLGVHGTPTILLDSLEYVGSPGLTRMDEYIANSVRRRRR
jgi:protein-disulfide isomerase